MNRDEQTFQKRRAEAQEAIVSAFTQAKIKGLNSSTSLCQVSGQFILKSVSREGIYPS